MSAPIPITARNYKQALKRLEKMMVHPQQTFHIRRRMVCLATRIETYEKKRYPKFFKP